jgi:hypothetical protein
MANLTHTYTHKKAEENEKSLPKTRPEAMLLTYKRSVMTIHYIHTLAHT